MPESAEEKLSLTNEETEWLMTVYNLRRKNLFFSGAFRCLLNCFVSFITIYFIICVFHDVFFYNGYTWLTSDLFTSDWIIKLSIIFALTAIICALAYFYWILPFKSDALSGFKYRRQFIVVAKEYYETTNQYFVQLQDPLEKLYEITADAFNNCEEGGIIYMDQTAKSGYIFCLNDHAKIKLFVLKRPIRYSYGWG